MQIVETPSGELLVSSNRNIFRYNGTSFEPLPVPNTVDLSQANEDVRQYFGVTRSNVLFIGTVSGIWAIDLAGNRVPRKWTVNDELCQNTKIRAISIKSEKLIHFVAGTCAGELIPEKGIVKVAEIDHLSRGEIPIAIIEDKFGTVWLRTINSILRLDPGSQKYVEDGNGVAESSTGGIPILDRSGRLLVPSTVGLFLKEKSGDWRLISAHNGLRSSAITAVYEDREKGLWIGLSGVGVQRWRGRSMWSAWDKSNGLPNSGIWGSFRDDRERLWVGVNDGIGIWDPKSERWTILKSNSKFLGRRAWKFVNGPDGRVWCLFRRKGINRFHPDTLVPEALSIPEYLLGDDLLEMIRTPRGSVLVGHSNKLLEIKYQDGRLEFNALSMPAGFVGRIEEASFAPDGSLWTSGVEGLAVYDGDDWRRLGKQDGLKVDGVRNVIALSAHEAWIGYREIAGVSHIKLSGSITTLTHITTAEGLADDRVWMMGRGVDGRIWVGGTLGISVIAEDFSIETYTRDDGLIWNDINQGSFSIDERGGIFIGTSQGLAHYNTMEYEKIASLPGITITSAKLGGKEFVNTDNPSIPHDKNRFSAKFAGLSFNSKQKISYKLQLIGLDTDPIETISRQVRYAALPAGKYTFEVWCRSAQGIWSEHPARFSFIVQTPWWQQWWFRVIILFASLCLVKVFFFWRTRRLERARKRLEIAVVEKSKALAKANEELKEMSFTDSLTKLRNRRYFRSVINTDISRIMRDSDPRTSSPRVRNRDLIFLIIDLDFFKNINDTYGHATGDIVLIEASNRIIAAMREFDLVVRWGGEEFLAVARDAEGEEAPRIAERILDTVGGTPIEIGDDQEIICTCSVGWSTISAHHISSQIPSYETTLNLADKGLYEAKQTGRNRAVGLSIVDVKDDGAEEYSSSDLSIEGLSDVQLQLIRVRTT